MRIKLNSIQIIQQIKTTDRLLENLGKHYDPEKMGKKMDFGNISEDELGNLLFGIYFCVFSSLEVQAHLIASKNTIWCSGLKNLQQIELGKLKAHAEEQEVFIFRQKLGSLGCGLAHIYKNSSHWMYFPKHEKDIFFSVFDVYTQGICQLLDYDTEAFEILDYRTLLDCLNTRFSVGLVCFPLSKLVSAYMESVSVEERQDIEKRYLQLKKEKEEEEAAKKALEKQREEIKAQRKVAKELQQKKKIETIEKRARLEEEARQRKEQQKEIQKQRQIEQEAREREAQMKLAEQKEKERQERKRLEEEQREKQRQERIRREQEQKEKERLCWEERERKRREEEKLRSERKMKESLERRKRMEAQLADPEFRKRKRELKLREDIARVTAPRPEDEYPDARKLKRRFILHVGPTNSGKTHDALERLMQSKNGAYFGPLRLLAMEVFDKCNRGGVPCSFITGEKTIGMPGENCKACTIEMLNIRECFDVVVIDECQMIQDDFRGHFWTRAILGIQANEIHLCMSQDASALIMQMIQRCGDEYEVIYHMRKTRLIVEDKEFSIDTDIQKGDALIVFSQKMALSLAADLRKRGFLCSVVYGKMPPKSRQMQVDRYINGETDIVVSTDAIGMGLNLPARRIVFMSVEKFNGHERALLTTTEIKQIAGRAGRFGLYDKGYVTAVERLDVIRNALKSSLPKITKANLGFPQGMLDIKEDFRHIFETWKKMAPSSLYKKMDISELLYLYEIFKEIHADDFHEFSNREIYRILSCSIDSHEEAVLELWKKYCKTFNKTYRLDFPLHDGYTAYDLEIYYKKLELYAIFSITMGLPYDEERLEKEKSWTEEKIEQLITQKYGSEKYCSKCGKLLPNTTAVEFCDACLLEYLRNSKFVKPI